MHTVAESSLCHRMHYMESLTGVSETTPSELFLQNQRFDVRLSFFKKEKKRGVLQKTSVKRLVFY